MSTCLSALTAQLGDAGDVARFRAAEVLARLYSTETTNWIAGLLAVLTEADRSNRDYFRLIRINTRTSLRSGEWSDETIEETTFCNLFADARAYVQSEAMTGLAFHAETCRTPSPPIPFPAGFRFT